MAEVFTQCSSCGAAIAPEAPACPTCNQPIQKTIAPPQHRPAWTKRLGPFGALAAALVKFKSLILLGFTKAKFLIFGLAKVKTLLTMLASMGLYWTLYGWKFAVGFVIGIYIHEMGHVWALRQFGLRASAPMFIPGFGAFVSLYDSPASVNQDARIGLAGPIWGTGAALAFLAPHFVIENGIWLALAHATALINLFNLIPVWQLDGGRGFRALNREERFLLLGLAGLLFFLTHHGILIFIMLGAAYRIFISKDHPAEGDRGAFFQFASLLVVLSMIGSLSSRYGFVR